MTSRILPREEWAKLAGTEAEPLIAHFDPARTSILVVEHDGAIVGTWTLMEVLHAECLWIAPAHRKHSAVARRLWAFMRRTAREMGVSIVATAAVSDDVRGLLAHVGATKVDGDHYAMRVN